MASEKTVRARELIKERVEMRVIDVDSHFHEPLDWLRQVDPALSDLFPPPLRQVDAIRALGRLSRPEMPGGEEPPDVLDSLPPGFVKHLEMSQDRQPERFEPGGDNPYYDAEARVRFCDEQGIDVQFLNPTYALSATVGAMLAGQPELIPRARSAWNRWAADQVFGHTDRLIPVTQVDLADIDWSIGELTRMRGAGSRAFILSQSSALGKSMTHPDFDRLWSVAEDLGMAVFAHVGIGREAINEEWANNGRDRSTHALLQMMASNQLIPQLVIGAMVLDGVFERHPGLVMVTEELGYAWLPHLIVGLDRSTSSPTLAGDSYTMPLAPSEYIQRQVRVAPLAQFDELHPVLGQLPSVLLCFSTDYPHVEGCANSVEVFSSQLTNESEEVRAQFFGGVGDLIGV